ncbi:hypothetical protein DF047_27815 [Burkholderia cenocepacia]|nr:hypothetical protein DF047_27815 [Burkholderia cenocepacia]
MGGALNDTRHRVKKTVAGRHRRIVSRAGIHSLGARVAARPTPCSRPPHGAGTNGPRIVRLGSRGRADTRGYPLVIK